MALHTSPCWDLSLWHASPLPTCPPFREDALQQFRGRFIACILRDEFPLTRGLEHSGLIPLEVGLRPFQRGDARIEPRELFFDLGDDALLFWERGNRNNQSAKF